MPREVATMWLEQSQDAFLREIDPSTGLRWADRYGQAFMKGNTVHGNVERFLSYKKLQRSGNMLRKTKVRVVGSGRTNGIELYNTSGYADEHNEGGVSSKTVIKEPYVKGGAKAVVLGGKIHPRPFMKPSKAVLFAPQNLLKKKMKSFGW